VGGERMCGWREDVWVYDGGRVYRRRGGVLAEGRCMGGGCMSEGEGVRVEGGCTG